MALIHRSDLPVDPDLPADSRSTGSRSSVRTPWRVLAAIAAGGALGGPARYGLGLAFPTAPHAFPTATFAINVGGAFALAILLVLIMDVWPPTTYVRPFLCVGFLAAFTTFSTWMVDTDRLLATGAYGSAAANLAGSLGAGLAATSLGLVVGRGFGTWRVRRRAQPTQAVSLLRRPPAEEPLELEQRRVRGPRS